MLFLFGLVTLKTAVVDHRFVAGGKTHWHAQFTRRATFDPTF